MCGRHYCGLASCDTPMGRVHNLIWPVTQNCYEYSRLRQYGPDSQVNALHAVHAAVLAPPPEVLAKEIEHNAEKTPNQDQARVRHDRWDEPVVSKYMSRYTSLQESTYPASILQGVINLPNP